MASQSYYYLITLDTRLGHTPPLPLQRLVANANITCLNGQEIQLVPRQVLGEVCNLSVV